MKIGISRTTSPMCPNLGEEHNLTEDEVESWEAHIPYPGAQDALLRRTDNLGKVRDVYGWTLEISSIEEFLRSLPENNNRPQEVVLTLDQGMFHVEIYDGYRE